MQIHSIRLAVRALIVKDNKLLLVNAYGGRKSDLWCAPGGGAEPGQSLPDNLKREVFEETGLGIEVGNPCLVNEFHNPKDGFHQTDVYFQAVIVSGTLSDTWADPEGVVSKRRFFSREELGEIRFKPDSLPQAAWRLGPIRYDPLEVIVR